MKAPAAKTAMIGSDDAFDAVIAALITRAHTVGGTHPVPPTLREQADREGWIALPSIPLHAIFEGIED